MHQATTQGQDQLMAHSIPSNHIDNNSQTTIVRSVTTRKFNSLPPREFSALKARQHAQAEKIIIENKYKTPIAATFHELINLINGSGISRVSRETLSKKLRCTVRTIGRHLDRLETDHVISRKKNGWRVSNATTVLFVQHELNHKEDKRSSYLTPHDSLRENHHEGGLKQPKREVAFAFADASEAPQEHEEQELTDEQKEHAKNMFKILKEMLSNGVN